MERKLICVFTYTQGVFFREFSLINSKTPLKQIEHVSCSTPDSCLQEESVVSRSTTIDIRNPNNYFSQIQAISDRPGERCGIAPAHDADKRTTFPF